MNVIKSGQGTVTSTPAGINCGNSCSSSFEQGEITLTASPSLGRIFTGWSGVNCSGGNGGLTCTFNLSLNTTVIANFAIDPNYIEF